jgi:hypothetical protein
MAPSFFTPFLPSYTLELLPPQPFRGGQLGLEKVHSLLGDGGDKKPHKGGGGRGLKAQFWPTFPRFM